MSLARRMRRGSLYKKPHATKSNKLGGRRYTQQTIILGTVAKSISDKLTKTIIHDITKK